MNLSRLFVVHGVITFAAGVVLVVEPGLIPSTVGVVLPPAANLIAYLLGGAELAIAVLSIGAARLKDVQALRLVVVTFTVFHLSTAAFELYAMVDGLSAKIIANVVVRIVVTGLFWWQLRATTRQGRPHST